MPEVITVDSGEKTYDMTTPNADDFELEYDQGKLKFAKTQAHVSRRTLESRSPEKRR